jgi:hypothetical protein
LFCRCADWRNCAALHIEVLALRRQLQVVHAKNSVLLENIDLAALRE